MLVSILTTAVAGLGVLGVLLYFYMQHKNSYWKRRNVVSQEPYLIFGNLWDLARRRVNIMEPYKVLYDAFPNEKVVGIYRMWSPSLLIRDPDVMRHVFIKDFDLFVNRGVEFGKEGLGSNLFHADSDSWRVLRSRLSPIFTSGKLKNMMPLLHRQADKFMEYLETEVRASPEQDIYPLVQKFTIGAISSCAFGIDIDMADLAREDNVFKKLDKLMFTNNYFSDLDLMFPGLLKKMQMSLFPKFVIDFFYGMVDNLMKDRKGVPSNRKDFMDLMLELKNSGEIHGSKKHENDKERTLQITEDLMAAQAFVFYAAGYETSASTLSFLMRLLALHQDVQDKVYEEIERVTSATGGVVTYEALKDMTYLGQVMDETLRMFPIIDIQRYLSAPTYKVPGTDVTVEKGTILMVSVRGFHYDERYYPEPHKFDPERFSPENVKERHPCVYMPFGLGPRNCIGMRFAMVQSRLAVVSLLKKYRVLPTENTKKEIEYDTTRITLAIKGENPVKLVPRN